MYQLIKQWNESSEQQKPLEDMTKQEMACELEGLVAEMVGKKPEIAAAYLEEAGWTLMDADHAACALSGPP